MNIAFFLTPKSQVVWLDARETLERALARMRPHGYSAVPLLDAGGVPVIDDRGAFIGIVRRKVIIEHCSKAGGPGF
jgi:CBS domain-containing protein